MTVIRTAEEEAAIAAEAGKVYPDAAYWEALRLNRHGGGLDRWPALHRLRGLRHAVGQGYLAPGGAAHDDAALARRLFLGLAGSAPGRPDDEELAIWREIAPELPPAWRRRLRAELRATICSSRGADGGR